MDNRKLSVWMVLGLVQVLTVCLGSCEVKCFTVEFTEETKCFTAKDCETPGSTDSFSCQDSKCVPCGTSTDGQLFVPNPCKPSKGLRFGDSCTPGSSVCAERMECHSKERKCKCRKGEFWDILSSRCHSESRNRFDPTRDVIIPSIILMTLAASAWLCFRLFCNCGKTFRRRRRGNEVARALEEAQIPGIVPSQSTTWVASYRVFGPVPGMDSRGFPPCLLLPAGPPSYDESFKHKVILSSYQPPLLNNSLL